MATDRDRERARRVLDALRALPPGTLDTVAQTAQGANGVLLAQVRAALATSDPEAALAGVLAHLDPDVASPLLDPRMLFASVQSITGAVAPVRAELDAIAAGQRALIAEGERARELAIASDPVLLPFVEAAIDLLCDDTMFAVLREAVDAIGGVGALVDAITRGQASPAQLAARMSELRQHRANLEHAMALLADVPRLLGDAADAAFARGDFAGAARLRVGEAALRGDDPALWQQAFDLACASELLPVARAAATRVELAAARDGRLADLATTAGQLANMAARAGEPDVELAAVGDQALACAQLPGRADEARGLVDRGRTLAAGDPVREVRAHLLAGQVAEKLGDDEAARLAFRKVMDRARGVALEHELGWAALHLGRLEAEIGQSFRAGQDLELAQHVGGSLGDAALFALALGARVDTAADRAAAERVLRDATGAPPDVQRELQRRIAARWAPRA